MEYGASGLPGAYVTKAVTVERSHAFGSVTAPLQLMEEKTAKETELRSRTATLKRARVLKVNLSCATKFLSVVVYFVVLQFYILGNELLQHTILLMQIYARTIPLWGINAMFILN